MEKNVKFFFEVINSVKVGNKCVYSEGIYPTSGIVIRSVYLTFKSEVLSIIKSIVISTGEKKSNRKHIASKKWVRLFFFISS